MRARVFDHAPDGGSQISDRRRDTGQRDHDAPAMAAAGVAAGDISSGIDFRADAGLACGVSNFHLCPREGPVQCQGHFFPACEPSLRSVSSRTSQRRTFQLPVRKPAIADTDLFPAGDVRAPGAFFIVLRTLIWVGKWDWMLAMVMLGTVVSTVWVMQRTRSRIQRLHSDYQKTETKVTGMSRICCAGRDVKLYAMEDGWRRISTTACGRWAEKAISATFSHISSG